MGQETREYCPMKETKIDAFCFFESLSLHHLPSSFFPCQKKCCISKCGAECVPAVTVGLLRDILAGPTENLNVFQCGFKFLRVSWLFFFENFIVVRQSSHLPEQRRGLFLY